MVGGQQHASLEAHVLVSKQVAKDQVLWWAILLKQFDIANVFLMNSVFNVCINKFGTTCSCFGMYSIFIFAFDSLCHVWTVNI